MTPPPRRAFLVQVLLSRTALVVLAMAIGVAALLMTVTWWLESGSDHRPAPASVEETAKAAPSPNVTVAAPAGDARAAAPAPARDGGPWIRGRVLLPLNTPADEVVHIHAFGRKPRSDVPIVAHLEADRTFRVGFPAEARGVELRIDSQHLYMEPVLLALDPRPGEVVLEPQLGGRIVGRIATPAGAEDAPRVLAAMRMKLWDLGERAKGVQHTTSVDPEGRFEFRGVPPERDWKVGVEACPWRLPREPLARITPGETRGVELAPTLGVRLSGRVVDEGGGDLRGASLARGTGTRAEFSALGEIPLAADGRFDARGLAPGPCKLRAGIPGRLAALLDLGELHDGQHVDGLELRLSAGAVIAGRVLWGTGERPASGVQVHTRHSSVLTDAEGRFTFTGLDPELSSSLLVEAEPRADSGLDAGAEPGKWLARAERVPHGSEAVTLRLEPGLTVRGMLRDDMGRPAAGVRILAHAYADGVHRQIAKCSSHEDGTYVLCGLWPQRITLSAHGEGFAPLPEVAVDPRERATLDLKLLRMGSIAGLVLGPDGAPVEHALVQFGAHAARSGPAGEFQIAACTPGRIRGGAVLEGYQGSEILELQLEPAQALERIVLRLRAGTRLTGELAPDLAPVAGRNILIEGELRLTVRTDGKGRFEAAGLPPGEYAVSLEHHADELQRSITVKATTEQRIIPHVVLVAEPVAAPVRIFGTVTDSSGPVAGCSVRASEPFERGWRWSSAMDATTDAQGQYELVVNGAGPYRLWVQGPGGSTDISVHEVPAEARFRLDFRLESGALTGRVVGPEGEPLGNVLLFLQPHVPGQQGSERAISANVLSNHDGSFAFEHLRDGSYQIFAAPALLPGSAGSAGALRQAGFQIEGGSRIAGVELRLPRGGTLTGILRGADGSPAAGVELHLHGELAAPMRMSPAPRTDAEGRYLLEGLAPGAWSLFASDGKRWISAESPLLEVDGETVHHDLELMAGTSLQVLCQGSDGKLESPRVSVVDARGRDHGQRWIVPPSATDAGAMRIGPLAPGLYRIAAHGADGARASVEVRLAGEPERSVSMQLQKP